MGGTNRLSRKKESVGDEEEEEEEVWQMMERTSGWLCQTFVSSSRASTWDTMFCSRIRSPDSRPLTSSLKGEWVGGCWVGW